MAAKAFALVAVFAVAVSALESQEVEAPFSFSLGHFDHEQPVVTQHSSVVNERFCNDPVCFFNDEADSFLQMANDLTDDEDDFEIMLETSKPDIEPNRKVYEDQRPLGDAIGSMDHDMSPISMDKVNRQMGKGGAGGAAGTKAGSKAMPVVTMRLADANDFNVKTFRAGLAAYLKIDPIEMQVEARRESGTIMTYITFTNETERALGSAEIVVAKFQTEKDEMTKAVGPEVIDVGMVHQGPGVSPAIYDHAGKTEGGLFGDFKIKVFRDPSKVTPGPGGNEPLNANRNFSAMFKCETVCAPPPPSKALANPNAVSFFEKDVCEMRGGKWLDESCAPFLRLTKPAPASAKATEVCAAQFGSGYTACSSVQALALSSWHKVPQDAFYWVASDANTASSAKLMRSTAASVECLDGTASAYEHKFGSSTAACVSEKRSLPTMCCHDAV